MVDKVRPLKLEEDEFDQIPTEVNPTQDYVATKGISFEGSDNQLIDVVEGQLRFKDGSNGNWLLRQILIRGRIFQ